MREIEFRAWRKDTKVMIDCYTTGLGFQDASLNDFLNETDNLIFLQYTGLKDKNNKKIFEGDLIQITLPEWEDPHEGYQDSDGEFEHDTWDERTIICEVKIRNTKGAGMVFRKDVFEDNENVKLKNHWFKIHSKTDEVIGNIYDNPELAELKLQLVN